ncbi:MAG: MmcQ/YjbR family DNA-binding protein [Vicinamibacterales bacterium]
MTAAAFRRIALGMQGAVERAHMAHPDFRVGGRIFATLRGDGLHGMVTVPLEHQARFVRDFPGVFAPESGAWGRAGSTRVVLKQAKEDTVGEAMTLAWQHAVAKGPTRTKPARPKQPAR